MGGTSEEFTKGVRKAQTEAITRKEQHDPQASHLKNTERIINPAVPNIKNREHKSSKKKEILQIRIIQRQRRKEILKGLDVNNMFLKKARMRLSVVDSISDRRGQMSNVIKDRPSDFGKTKNVSRGFNA